MSLEELQGFEADEEEDAMTAAKALVDFLADEGFRDMTKAVGKDRWLRGSKVYLAAWFKARAARANVAVGDGDIPF